MMFKIWRQQALLKISLVQDQEDLYQAFLKKFGVHEARFEVRVLMSSSPIDIAYAQFKIRKFFGIPWSTPPLGSGQPLEPSDRKNLDQARILRKKTMLVKPVPWTPIITSQPFTVATTLAMFKSALATSTL
ncbi:hypothetical protein F3Y22_tig00006613pilonHSYRG00075 [Hibiscus syriacus]|uniref:Uncharacterized protein n=1 Tax=Hibiscus syriacus TaxID=106335 RepID=A0A6A3CCS9_HIBSY|nr:hypothetical protein F3Y22_tig00006613pilonHSYRG00075 [Hibiscus syriacus]